MAYQIIAIMNPLQRRKFNLITFTFLASIALYNDFCDSLCTAFALFPTSSFRNIQRINLYNTDEKANYGLILFSALNDDEMDDDKNEDADLGDRDWRDFRAKLVMSDSITSKPAETGAISPTTTAGDELNQDDITDMDGIGAIFDSGESPASKDYPMTPLDLSQWAYDSGNVIEQGAVILGGVEQEYGFGLRQQYFHKAAMLVLDHDEKKFTKGVILNRPTDLLLEDDINDGIKWRVWFGGDVQGLASPNPEIICLHSLKDDQVMRTSVPVMKDIQWTTFENAKQLVKIGVAKCSDFWVFAGYAGWGPGQLMGELDRKSWYMVATDSQTLLQELSRQTAGTDPRDAGLDTWNLLMSMIGRSKVAANKSNSFDDLMLKEWALQNLLSKEAGGGGGMMSKITIWGQQTLMGMVGSIDSFLQKQSLLSSPLPDVEKGKLSDNVGEGSLLRASSALRSPFLLDDQQFHKSVVLIIDDDENLSIGIILNRPTTKGLELEIKDRSTGNFKKEVLPLRYGGEYAIRGKDSVFWLHCNRSLKAAGVGSKIGSNKENSIYKCSVDDVKVALGSGLARPEDFLVVTGVSIWAKGDSTAQGIKGLVENGIFHLIERSETDDVWRMLLRQGILSESNLVQNLAIANKAWSRDGDNSREESETNLIGGLDENFDEEDENFVYKSDVKVSDLCDKALRKWIATFLLGSPSMDT